MANKIRFFHYLNLPLTFDREHLLDAQLGAGDGANTFAVLTLLANKLKAQAAAVEELAKAAKHKKVFVAAIKPKPNEREELGVIADLSVIEDLSGLVHNTPSDDVDVSEVVGYLSVRHHQGHS